MGRALICIIIKRLSKNVFTSHWLNEGSLSRRVANQ